MLSRTTFLFPVLLNISLLCHAQDKCNCPPIKMYVYDTKIDFPLDSSYIKNGDGVYVGKYIEAQNSGDWLVGAYFKQQSDEFKIYKGLRPGAKTGTTYEPPPDNKGNPEDGIDFSSYAQIDRSLQNGIYSYKVLISINDVYRHVVAIVIDTSTNDLGQADDLIDKMISENSPIINQLRDYQKDLRDRSLSASDETEHMWIGLKFKAVPEKTKLKVGETTKVHLKVFDCIDEKPAPNQSLNIRVGSPNVGMINLPGIKSNSSGEATVSFTAKNIGETSVFPDFTYTAVNRKSGYHVLDCGDLKTIQVIADDRNYFYLGNSTTGNLYEVKEPLLASFRATQDRADYVNGQWNIMVNGIRKMSDDSAMQPMSLAITITQSDTGTYKWTVNGNSNTGLTPPFNSVTVVGSDGSPFQYASWDCLPHGDTDCKLTALEGSTTITVFDKKKKIIKGYFSGMLVSPAHQSIPVSGAFSVSIQYIQ